MAANQSAFAATVIPATPVTVSSTAYYPVGAGIGGGTATEAAAQLVIRTAATAQNLHVRVTSNATTAASTIKLRKNGADTALGVSVSAGATGQFSDTTDAVSLIAGDLVALALVPGSANAIALQSASLELQTAGQCATMLGTGRCTGNAVSSFAAVGHTGVVINSDPRSKAIAPEAATFSHLQVAVSANGSASTSAFGFRVNSVAATQSISVPAGTTGLFEDTSHSDSVSAGDFWDFTVSSGADATVQFLAAVRYVGAVAGRVALGAERLGTASAATGFGPVLGNGFSSSEGDVQVPAPVAGVWSSLSVSVGVNSNTASVVVSPRH